MQKKLLSSFLVILLMGVCAIVNAQPANDEPTGAIEVTLGQNGPFTTVDSTPNPDDLAGGTCSTNDWNEPDIQSSVWFTYTGDGNEIIITTNSECIDADADEVTDTQIAIFEGAVDGPNVACHDDTSGTNYYSTVQFPTTVGTTYYVLVDGWENDNNPLILGDFCVRLEDPNAAVCGNGVCDPGEDFENCPADCVCEANSVYVDLSGPSLSDIPIAYCASESDGVPDGTVGVAIATFGGVGDLTDFPYDFSADIGSASGQLETDGTNVSIGYLLLTQEELDAGGTVTITFSSTINSCGGTLSFDIADLNISDIATDCDAGTGAECGNGVCEDGEDNANCPGDCPPVEGVCGEFVPGADTGGPWPQLSEPSCDEGGVIEAGYAAWPNEAYIINVVALTQYTFDICEGFDPTVEGWNGGVVLSAYIDANNDGVVDDVANPIATGTECSLTFVAEEDGVIMIVVNDADCSVEGLQANNGNVTLITNTDCGAFSSVVCGNGVCEDGEDSANCPGDCPPPTGGDRACSTDPDCEAEYGAPSPNIPLLTLPPGAISESWEFSGFNTDDGYIFGYILTADLDCNDNSTGYNILDFNTTGIFDFAFDGPLSFDGGGIGPGCFGPNAGLYNVFAISFQGTQAELEDLIFNVYPTAEELEDAILDGNVCACMPSPGDDDQGLSSLFILEQAVCEAEAGEVNNPAGGTTVCSGGGSITVGVSGNNTDVTNYIQVFVLTDLNFTIIEVSTNGVFSIPSGTGGYIAHSLNVNASESDALNQNLVGLNVSDVAAQLVCFDVSPGGDFTADDVVTVSEDGGLKITDEYDCNESSGESTVTISISGGSGVYTVSGDVTGTFSAGQNITVTLTSSDRDISISAFDAAGCSNTFAQVYPECTKTAVELLSFDGRAQANDNLLFWATATEENSSHFNVQRSSDGYTFTTIGKVAGAGNSNVTVNYNYNDVNVDAGTATYRLEMVDFDGTVEYSNTVILTRRSDFGIVELAPIPAVNLLNVAFNNVEDAVTRVEVISISGRVLSVVEVEARIGINRVQLDITDYASGIYLISVSNGNNNEIKKFIKE